VGGGADLLVDVQDAAVEADEERPARREGLVFVDDAVRRGDGTCRIAQKRVVDAQRPRKRPVGLRSVDADREERGVEAPDFVATLTE
jgi:hypothetical protein